MVCQTMTAESESSTACQLISPVAKKKRKKYKKRQLRRHPGEYANVVAPSPVPVSVPTRSAKVDIVIKSEEDVHNLCKEGGVEGQEESARLICHHVFLLPREHPIPFPGTEDYLEYPEDNTAKPKMKESHCPGSTCDACLVPLFTTAAPPPAYNKCRRPGSVKADKKKGGKRASEAEVEAVAIGEEEQELLSAVSLANLMESRGVVTNLLLQHAPMLSRPALPR